MTEWQLIDFAAPLEDDEESPRMAIHSEEQLREELRRCQGRRPAMIALMNPAGERLDIGIGGPWAGMQWTKPPHARTLKLALATGARSPAAIDFACEGASSGFRPEHLLPAGEAIEAAVHYFAHHRLPEWITWAEWSPKTNRMEAVPASASPPALPTLDAAPSTPPATSS
jgi:hypothetical protein